MRELISFEDFQKLWERDPIVIIDSCSLLDMYRYSSNTTEQILNNFEQIRDYIWIPKQVLDEFTLNKEEVRTKAFNKYTDVTKDVTAVLKSAHSKVGNSFVRYTKFKFPEISNLEMAIEKHMVDLLKTVDDFKDVVANEINQNKAVLKADQVLGFVESLIEEDKVGIGLQTTEKLKAYQEGENRYFYKIPPGYMDIEKDKTDLSKTKKFGDLIIWKELLKKSNEEDVPFIFITDDVKEDWWLLAENKEILAPRQELISEFYEHSLNKNEGFLMLTLSQFNSHISKINRSNNVESHQSFVEMNAEEIAYQILESKEWDLILDKDFQLTFSMINDGILEDFIGQNIKDVEIYASSFPVFENIYVDFDDNNILIDGNFLCSVEANIETSFSKHYFEDNKANIELRGNFSIESTLNYEKQEDFIDFSSSEFSVDDIELIACVIEDEQDYSEIACINCNKEVGSYHTSDNEPVCQNCLSYFETCVSCGTLYRDGELGGYPCEKCAGTIDAY